MRIDIKKILASSFLAFLVSAIILFMVFAVRTILDPLYKNTELIETSKQIFSMFIWPYNLIEKKFIGIGPPDYIHSFHPFWSPLGILCTLLYIAVIGNLVSLLVNAFFRQTTD